MEKYIVTCPRYLHIDKKSLPVSIYMTIYDSDGEDITSKSKFEIDSNSDLIKVTKNKVSFNKNLGSGTYKIIGTHNNMSSNSFIYVD
jgi:hypothetical protein